MRKILVALLGLLACASLASADTLFPNAPTTGQIYNFNNTGVLYQWDGAKWITTGTTSPAITKQVFTASGTYTPSSGMQYAIIECLAGGGAGGGSAGAASNNMIGSGGGAGGRSIAFVTAGQVGASQTVTIGAGGTAGTAGNNPGNDGNDTSVGSLCVAKKGSGGPASTSAGAFGTGGAGGTTTGAIGDEKFPGENGNGGYSTTNTPQSASAGKGGNTPYGQGGQVTTIASNGVAGSGYGSGGSGGGATGASNTAGGAGAGGYVRIIEFLSSQWGGPLPQVVPPQGRLTLTSGTPVTTADVTAATTVYYTPYHGSFIPLWNGTQFTPVYFNEISAAMGSNWSASTLYDWYVYNDAGTLRLCTGAAWTNSAAGTSARSETLTLKQGIYVNNASMTCRYSNSATVTVAAYYGTYVGTMRTTGSTGTTEDSLLNRLLWNNYNRVVHRQEFSDGANWAYNTATIRQCDGSSSNQVNFVVGLVEDVAQVSTMTFVTVSTTLQPQAGYGLNSTTAFSQGISFIAPSTAAPFIEVAGNRYPVLGYNYLSGLEQGPGSGTTTWFGCRLQASTLG